MVVVVGPPTKTLDIPTMSILLFLGQFWPGLKSEDAKNILHPHFPQQMFPNDSKVGKVQR